jgi:glycosyltransferase involved in cell wall biosynthesis
MKIGILGTRGIPNAYGGFEQFAQHLALGLAEKNHEVFVYNSSDHPYVGTEWRGISILVCKDWENKIGTAGQFFYDYNCFRDARKREFDILLQLGYTSNSIWHWLWPKNAINIINMDGLEWKRSKYNKPTQKFLKVAEKLAVRHADVLISDSIGIRDYIQGRYHRTSHYIPYGADIPASQNHSGLSEWKIEPFKYYLLIARMEPENNIEMIIEGFLQTKGDWPLIIIGNHGNKFGQHLRKKYGNDRIKFLGSLYEEETLNTLRSHATVYFHGHSVGGTNPSLLEAMACRCNIAAHANIFNKAILENAAYYFSSAAEVKAIIESLLDCAIIKNRKEINIEKIKSIYNWNNIVDEYEKVFLSAAAAVQPAI